MIRGDASPGAGFEGPVNAALSLISRKSEKAVPEPIVKVLPESVRSAPAKVRVGPEPVELDKLRKLLSVSTVLALNAMRGSDVVLVKVEPSTTLKNRLPISKVLPISLRSGPARLTVAGPGVPGNWVVKAESSTLKKLKVVLKVLAFD